MPADGGAYQAVVRDLEAQHRVLDHLLDGCTDADLDLPTPADGWAVRHQLAHLADTDEVAADTVHAGPRRFDVVVRTVRSAEEFTAAGVARAEGRPVESWKSSAKRP